jgi:uncharacterized membrane protein YedE/YeeE
MVVLTFTNKAAREIKERITTFLGDAGEYLNEELRYFGTFHAIARQLMQEHPNLETLGFSTIGESLLPPELFSWDAVFSIKGFLILVVGGFLVGFGTRYAGGCTSGHAITGLSSLQLPSLIAVIGFFIGGLIMINFIYPILF